MGDPPAAMHLCPGHPFHLRNRVAQPHQQQFAAARAMDADIMILALQRQDRSGKAGRQAMAQGGFGGEFCGGVFGKWGIGGRRQDAPLSQPPVGLFGPVSDDQHGERAEEGKGQQAGEAVQVAKGGAADIAPEEGQRHDAERHAGKHGDRYRQVDPPRQPAQQPDRRPDEDIGPHQQQPPMADPPRQPVAHIGAERPHEADDAGQQQHRP